jgi:RNA polymerase sigma factor (sigma-70 family)
MQTIMSLTGMIRQLASRHVRAGVEYDDLVQDAFVAALEAQRRWNSQGRPGALSTYVHLNVRSRLRDAVSNKDPLNNNPISLDSGSTDCDTMLWNGVRFFSRKQELHEVIGAAGDQERSVVSNEVISACAAVGGKEAVVLGALLQGLSGEEIAEKHGMSRRSVYDHYERGVAKALKRLKRKEAA